jgi:competence protein ComEC
MRGGWASVETIGPCYDELRPRWRQSLSDPVVLALAAVAVLGAVAADRVLILPVAVAIGGLLLSLAQSAKPWMVVLLVVVGVVAAGRSQQSWDSLAPTELGLHRGWARVITDPRPGQRATRVVIEVDQQRFEIWASGEHQAQLQMWRAGELVKVRGERRALPPDRVGRVAAQHVVGRYQLYRIDGWAAGSPLARGSNQLRIALERGSEALPGADAALFRGLVVGDRSGQPPEMVERFRSSGLSHLLVVSGLNVSLLLVACGPGLRRLRPLLRWLATVALVAWFVSLTRFEPSIVRAGMMAAISATAFATGRERAPARILCLAVGALMLIDPLLVRSLGFWLSVGATAGVCTIGPWLSARCHLLGPLAAPLGITLGAQAGVAIPLVGTFGHLPLTSIPANLAAVPVASFVKLYGLPAGLVAGWFPPSSGLVMFPVRLGVRWVDTVASLAARSEPSGHWAWVGWIAVVLSIAVVVGRSPGKNPPRDDGAPADRR